MCPYPEKKNCLETALFKWFGVFFSNGKIRQALLSRFYETILTSSVHLGVSQLFICKMPFFGACYKEGTGQGWPIHRPTETDASGKGRFVYPLTSTAPPLILERGRMGWSKRGVGRSRGLNLGLAARKACAQPLNDARK